MSAVYKSQGPESNPWRRLAAFEYLNQSQMTGHLCKLTDFESCRKSLDLESYGEIILRKICFYQQ
jgi:hypothetical protein